MPALRRQKLSRRSEKVRVDWENLGQTDKIALIEKLAGPRPEVPTDIGAPQWSEQSLRVLKERYFLKDNEGNPIETVEKLCWRVAWEMARAEVRFGRNRQEIIALARDFYKMY
jgi:hypothetical protein